MATGRKRSKVLVSSNKALPTATPLPVMLFQALPSNHCQLPSVLLFATSATTATPARALANEPATT